MRALALVLVAACESTTGTVRLELATAPGSTVMDAVETLRLVSGASCIRGGAATSGASWPALDTGQQITSFGEDARGEIYVVPAGGTIYRIAPGR